MAKTDNLTSREKLAIRFILLAIQILGPWDSDFKFKEILDELKKAAQ